MTRTLMRMADRSARRPGARAAAKGVPLVSCPAGQTKHLFAGKQLETHVVITGVSWLQEKTISPDT
jgi:hypothetical protein